MPALQRNTEVDAVRFAALVGICVVNVPFMGLPLPDFLAQPAALIDRVAQVGVSALFIGKFFLLFSFIFGWGLFVQEQAASRAAATFGPRYARRLAGLAMIGIAHALLVFTGDILVLYAILGALLWPMRRLSPRALMAVALALVPVGAGALTLLSLALGGPMPELDVGAGLGGSFAEATATRVAEWPSTFVFVVLFNGPLALAAFAAGLAAAKTGFFEPGNRHFERLAGALPWLIAIGITLNLLYALSFGGYLFPRGSVPYLLVSGSLAVGAPCLSAAYLICIVRLVRRFEPAPSWLAAGRNSLTTYVTQGVLAGFAFGAYGLGLFGELGNAALLLLALAIAGLTLLVSAAAYGPSRRGPLEWLLRRITRGMETVPPPALRPGA
jgi:uncharacterized protein